VRSAVVPGRARTVESTTYDMTREAGMTFAHVLVEKRERLAAHRSRPGHIRAARLSLALPVLALALAACKKSDTATPSDQAPGDTAATSQADPYRSAPEPAAAPVSAPAEAAPQTAAAEPVDRTPSVRTAEAAPAPAPIAATAPVPAAAPVATTAPVPATAPVQASAPVVSPAPTATPTPAPESSAPADTPSASGQASGQGAGAGQGQASGQGQARHATLDATPEVYEGWKHFSANCERCHGQDAVGSSFAPSLIKSLQEGSVLGTGALTHDLFIGTVVAGRPAKGMPSWAQLLDREKMENIWAYLNARASGQLAPGRPIKKGG
jgi:hypothetical protein